MSASGARRRRCCGWPAAGAAAFSAALLVGWSGAGCSPLGPGLRTGRALVEAGRFDDALSVWNDLETRLEGASRKHLARYHFLRGATLLELRRFDEAHSELHAAQALLLEDAALLAKGCSEKLAQLIARADTELMGKAAEGAPGGGEEGEEPTSAPSPGAKAPKAAAAKVAKPAPETAKAPASKPAEPEIVVACSGARNTPQGIYEGMIRALKSKDLDCVVAHFVPEYAEKAREILSFLVEVVESIDYEILAVKIDGDTATVKAKEKIRVSLDGHEETMESEGTYPLVRVAGVWKLKAMRD